MAQEAFASPIHINTAQGTRIASIDILRALTMVLMVFVNDLWSLKDIPAWLEHVSWSADGMGLADVVFPAFLFIVGLSVPAAIASRRKKGDNTQQIVLHILSRSMALLVMGLFLVNGEYIHEEATGIKRLIWNSLSCISFILIWNVYPVKSRWSKVLPAIGMVILVVLGVMYRGSEGKELLYFSTYWWGILGLIGWAYLVSALIYLFWGDKAYVLYGTWLLFLMASGISQTDLLNGTFLPVILGPLGGGAFPALVLGGILTSLLFRHYQQQGEDVKLVYVAGAIALALLALGFYVRSFWGISKLRATPSWVLICSAITILLFVLIYWISDRKGKAHWFNFIKPAGTGTLVCYLLPYFAYTLVSLLNIHWPEPMLTGVTGLLKSFAFALLCVGVTALLARGGVKLKL